MNIGNARGGAGGGDLEGVVSDIVESFGLAYNGGSGSGSAVQPARSTRIGGIDAMTQLGSAAFWQPDGLGGIYGAYALASQVQAGNASVDPRGENGRAYRHYATAIPLGWRPSLVTGGLAALPFNYQADIETVVRKASNAGAADVWTFGFENPNLSSIFLNAQGSMGFLLFAPGNSSLAASVYCRADGSIAPSGFSLPLPSAIDVGTAPVRLRWRVTWGTVWVAELFVNGSLVFSLTDADMNYQNLDQCTSTAQLWGYPVIYAGSNPIAGPYYSRATVRLVRP